jgi:hypothetical protein
MIANVDAGWYVFRVKTEFVLASALFILGTSICPSNGWAHTPFQILADFNPNEALDGKTVRCLNNQNQITQSQMDAILPVIANPQAREFHFSWHQIRQSWKNLSKQQKKQYLKEGWSAPEEKNLLILGNDENLESGKSVAGEDFLFMHRMMLHRIQKSLIEHGLPCINGWNPIPFNLNGDTLTGDSWPVPTESSVLPSTGDRQKILDEIKTLEKVYLEPNWLGSHSLSYVGQTIELTIHADMHLLWAGNPPAICEIDKNSPQCNYLLDNHSAIANPIFWKLHGWIDTVVNEWIQARGYKEIDLKCNSRPSCYQWKGTWVGKMMM